MPCSGEAFMLPTPKKTSFFKLVDNQSKLVSSDSIVININSNSTVVGDTTEEMNLLRANSSSDNNLFPVSNSISYGSHTIEPLGKRILGTSEDAVVKPEVVAEEISVQQAFSNESFPSGINFIDTDIKSAPEVSTEAASSSDLVCADKSDSNANIQPNQSNSAFVSSNAINSDSEEVIFDFSVGQIFRLQRNLQFLTNLLVFKNILAKEEVKSMKKLLSRASDSPLHPVRPLRYVD